MIAYVLMRHNILSCPIRTRLYKKIFDVLCYLIVNIFFYQGIDYFRYFLIFPIYLLIIILYPFIILIIIIIIVFNILQLFDYPFIRLLQAFSLAVYQ